MNALHAKWHGRMSAAVLAAAIVAATEASPPAVSARGTSSGSGAQGASLAIEHATVLPMDRDTALLDQTVLVVGDRIAWVGPSAAARVPPAARRIDARGRWLIPGLADMHVHLRSANELAAYAAAGITTVRNMRGFPAVLAWRDSVARGTLAGPRIYTSGPSIGRGAIFGDPEHLRLATEDDAVALVHAQRRAGYDMIKVLRRIERPVYDRLLLTARATRIPVVGHVVPEVGVAHTLAMGQVSLEHAEPYLFGGRDADFDAGARAIARAGAWVGTIVSARDGGCAPPSDETRRIVAALRRARVRLLVGSDAGIGPVAPGAGLHCELATLVTAGMSPGEALAAATRDVGEFARLHLAERVPFGVVRVGASADLVLLAADPRADIAVLRRPVGTVLRGAWRPAR